MRRAQTINDLKALFADHSVVPVLDGSNVYLAMPHTDEWNPDSWQQGQVAIRSKTVVSTDPESVQFQRTAHNTILGLVHSPQFMRVTTVADQMTIFYGHDNGSMPPMFLRGQGRQPSRQWRMTGLTKKAGEPFTVLFESPDAAVTFIKAIAGGDYMSLEKPSQTQGKA